MSQATLNQAAAIAVEQAAKALPELNLSELVPFGDRYLVRKRPQETTTASGLFLGAQTNAKVFFGEILQTGFGHLDEKRKTHKLLLDPGTIVCWSQYSGIEVEKDLIFLKYSFNHFESC